PLSPPLLPYTTRFRSESEGEAEGGDAPEGGGGGQAADATAAAHDGPGTEETDAGHDAVGNAGGVDAQLAAGEARPGALGKGDGEDRKSTRLNSSHVKS